MSKEVGLPSVSKELGRGTSCFYGSSGGPVSKPSSLQNRLRFDLQHLPAAKTEIVHGQSSIPTCAPVPVGEQERLMRDSEQNHELTQNSTMRTNGQQLAVWRTLDQWALAAPSEWKTLSKARSSPRKTRCFQMGGGRSAIGVSEQ